MYFITHYNRFGKRYTSVKTEKPTLKTTNTVHFSYGATGINNTPPLTEEDFNYTTFRIPKASGGFRTITAPSEKLKVKQRAILNYLKNQCHIIESPWAYAYVTNTCAVDALKKHQENHSKWFLKIDIKDFFPSCTYQVVTESLQKIYPICSWPAHEQYSFLNMLYMYCYKDEALPQGAVTSPFLSNITMIPYDYAIFQLLKKAETFKKQKYIYTRYADDILISAKTEFDYQKIVNRTQEIFGNKFIIKAEKTRYGSSSGRNWNLGCMLNKDNNITIGYKQKEEWKRKMMDIIIRHNNNENIPLEEKQQLMGKLAYYKMIEPDYFNYLNRHYQEKYNTNFETILKTQL